MKKYVPVAPAAWDKMTIYEVLTHTAGCGLEVAGFQGHKEDNTNTRGRDVR